LNGSLALRGGVLHVARHAKTAEVRTYDMDGARIGEGFTFAGLDGGPASATGIAVDADMRIWVADRAARCVRVFTVFGGELWTWSARGAADGGDRTDGENVEAASAVRSAGALADPVSVATAGVEDDMRVLVASGGARRHALQLFDRSGNLLQTLRARGDPQAEFRDVVRVSLHGRLAFACERKSGLVQVFRDGEFHWAFHAPRARTQRHAPEPRAVQMLADGRMLLATGGEGQGGVHLLDASGGVLRTLARDGEGPGAVFEPTDIALDEGESDRRSRFAVVDLDGDRVQVFTLEGVCYGSFADLPRATT
jgi:hypothetical protein